MTQILYVLRHHLISTGNIRYSLKAYFIMTAPPDPPSPLHNAAPRFLTLCSNIVGLFCIRKINK